MDSIANVVYVLAVQPVFNLLVVSYWLTFSSNLGFAMILLAALWEVVQLPLSLRVNIYQRLQPEFGERLQQLKAQFGHDPETHRIHQRAMFKETGYNPILWLFLPILTVVAAYVLVTVAIGQFQPTTTGGLVQVAEHAYGWLPKSIGTLQVNTQLLWMDLTTPDRIVMPLLVVAAMLSYRLVVRYPPPSRPRSRIERTVSFWLIPVIFAVLMLVAPSGLGVFVVADVIAAMVLHRSVIRWINGPPEARPQPQTDQN